MNIMRRCELRGAVGIAVTLLLGVAGGGAAEFMRQEGYSICPPAMYIFGDSYSDTGNGVLTGNPLITIPAEPPYGETVPGFPFDRFSDGLLIVDFLAIFFKLSFINPYLDRSADFRTGVDYAVSTSTALDTLYLNSIGIPTLSNFSLDTQLGWHLDFLRTSVYPNIQSRISYSHALIVIEIGGDDYLDAILASNYSVPYVQANLVPLVIAKIKNATEVLYASGAKNFLIMTLTPFGCFSIVLAYFPSGSKDKNGCLTSLNNLSLEHRRRLLQLIYELRATHKDARFVFFDFYAAYEEIISNSKAFGFRDTLDACCGAGPAFAYRYNMQLFCGPSSSVASMTLCPDPNVFLKWDGIHNTHRFNLLLSDTIRTGRNIDPPNAFAGCALHS